MDAGGRAGTDRLKWICQEMTYRKIDTRVWNDEKFRELSDDGKLVFFFLLTHPHMTSLGAMRATIPGLAAEMEWDTERLREAFAEAFAKGMAKHDSTSHFMWIPRFLRYNGPESPNVVKSWTKAFDMLPECSMKTELLQQVKGFAEGLPKAFAEAFAKGMGKGLAPAPAPVMSSKSKKSASQKRAPAGVETHPKGSCDTPEVRELWTKFCESVFRVTGTPLNEIQAEQILIELSRRGPEKASADLRFSILKGAKNLLDSGNDFEKRDRKKTYTGGDAF